MNIHDGYALEIEWSDPVLPRLIGPFKTRNEAEEWAALNIPNGVWNVAPLAWPYQFAALTHQETP